MLRRHSGVHRYRSECSDAADGGLHGVEGKVEVAAYRGDNPLLRHGPIRVAADRRHFEHADGTPFFWLGDTWWMGLCRRLHWPDEFKTLAADRRAKGLQRRPDRRRAVSRHAAPSTTRGANEAGFPWQTRLRADQPGVLRRRRPRVWHAWSTRGCRRASSGRGAIFLPWLGVERMKKHWRYLVARYGAVAGGLVRWPARGRCPSTSRKQPQDDASPEARLDRGGRYMRRIDPFTGLITIHPIGQRPRTRCDDAGRCSISTCSRPATATAASIPSTIRADPPSRATAQPPMPTVVGEVCYEGILRHVLEDVERFMFWASYLSGTAGPHLRRERHLAGATAAESRTARRRTAAIGATGRGTTP